MEKNLQTNKGGQELPFKNLDQAARIERYKLALREGNSRANKRFLISYTMLESTLEEIKPINNQDEVRDAPVPDMWNHLDEACKNFDWAKMLELIEQADEFAADHNESDWAEEFRLVTNWTYSLKRQVEYLDEYDFDEEEESD